jgi:hypothetical protein
VAGDPRRPTTLGTREHFRYYVPPDLVDLRISKATKLDDAEIPVHLWDDQLVYMLGTVHLSEEQNWWLGFLCRCFYRYWIRQVHHSWWKWWYENKSLLRLIKPKHWREIDRRGMATVNHASLSTIWDWNWGPRSACGIGGESINWRWLWVWPLVGWAPSPPL